jgi:putative membrane protein
MKLQPVARVRGDEGPATAVLLDAQLLLHRPIEGRDEAVLVEREPQVVDAGEIPLTGLHDDVDRAALQLGQPQLEAATVEIVPGVAGLERNQVVPHPPVAGDELEAELPEVARLDLPDPARDQVVVEEMHPPEPRLGGVSELPSLTSWSFDPLQLAPLVLVALIYGRRVRRLRRRGVAVPAWRPALFGTGVLLLILALASPIETIGQDELFTFHMVQHVLIGDLAPLALLAGLTGPILRPVLALPVVERLRVLVHPFVALPLWALNLAVWHLPVAYQGALHHESLHALEHLCFFTAGVLMWAPVLEILPGPSWFGSGAKMAYVAVVRLYETAVANVFLWAGDVIYPYYERGEELWGISPEGDQALAGGVMLVEGSLVTFAALAWLFLRLAREGELRQELLERGLDPRAVRRAVRYGRADALEQQQEATRAR